MALDHPLVERVFACAIRCNRAPVENNHTVRMVHRMGQIVENHAYRNDATGGYRLRLRVKQVDDKKPVEMRAFLRAGDTTLTPTWSYIVPPE